MRKILFLFILAIIFKLTFFVEPVLAQICYDQSKNVIPCPRNEKKNTPTKVRLTRTPTPTLTITPTNTPTFTPSPTNTPSPALALPDNPLPQNTAKPNPFGSLGFLGPITFGIVALLIVIGMVSFVRGQRKSGRIVSLDTRSKVDAEKNFHDQLVGEIGVPAEDSSQKDSSPLDLNFRVNEKGIDKKKGKKL
jgi:hypothetical protein